MAGALFRAVAMLAGLRKLNRCISLPSVLSLALFAAFCSCPHLACASRCGNWHRRAATVDYHGPSSAGLRRASGGRTVRDTGPSPTACASRCLEATN